MRNDIKPRIINGKKYTFRTKGFFEIEHDGTIYRIGDTTPGPAMKKAHAFVRKFVIMEWQRLRIPSEATVNVIADGERFCSVMGQYKNRAVHSYTLT